MRTFLHEPASLEVHRVERCWRRLLLFLVVAGPVLAVAGVGKTLLGLAVFLVVFAAAAAIVIVRDLKPRVSLISSTAHTRRASGV